MRGGINSPTPDCEDGRHPGEVAYNTMNDEFIVYFFPLSCRRAIFLIWRNPDPPYGFDCDLATGARRLIGARLCGAWPFVGAWRCM